MQSLAGTCFIEDGYRLSGVLRMRPAKCRVGFDDSALEGTKKKVLKGDILYHQV